ncbi:MAG: helix-turn-helix domain-containing protein [Agathobacter sp.]|nr:helix-turn-helix domain-containing protein [Agathobacter sp.]
MKLDQVQLLSSFYEKDHATIQRELLQHGIDFSNIYQELEMSSRFVDTHMDISFGDIPVNLHSHSYYEIVYVLSNSGTQYLVGTKRYQLQRGDVIFVPPGIGHKPLFPSQLAEPYKRIVLWVSADFIDGIKYIYPDYTPQFTEQVFLLRTLGTPWESVGTHFHIGLKEAQEKKEGWQFALCGNTMQLLTICLRALLEPETQPMKSEKPELLDDIVSYIESHLHEKISLADTASRFYVSESTIGQTFQKKMHVSFYHYVTQRRLIAAKSMILEEANLDLLSEKVGFTDYSTFYRAFKKEFGISPREYRNLIAENQQSLL